jgi:lipopolysaccharide biosynthesis glycosyltransferase
MSENFEASVDFKSISGAILMACDEGYAMPLATTLRSIAESNTGAGCIEVIVLTSYFSPEMQDKVVLSLPDQSVRVRWVPVELQRFQEFSTRTYISKITYARLLLSSLFPESEGKVLYLDADILVIGSLAPLWETDLDGAAVAAVVDTDSIDHSARLDSSRARQVGPAFTGTALTLGEYFNAGVLLIDLARWREEHVSEKALQFMAGNPETPLADQDALNFACAGRWKKLEARWNCQNHDPKGYAQMAPEQRPTIVHFAGKWKPWNPTTLSPDNRFYNDFRHRTMFARTAIETVHYSLLHGFALLRSYLRQFKTLHSMYRLFKTTAGRDCRVLP